MVAPLRRTVTVGPGGKIELRSSGLRPGSRAEIIVVPADAKRSPFFENAGLDELAAQQGITTSPTFKQMLGGWPADQRNDGFARAIAQWHREEIRRPKRGRGR